MSEIVDTRNDFLDHMMLKVDEFIQMKKAETGQHVFVIILDCVNTRGFAVNKTKKFSTNIMKMANDGNFIKLIIFRSSNESRSLKS